MKSEYKLEYQKHFEPNFKSLGPIVFEILHFWGTLQFTPNFLFSNAPSIWVFGSYEKTEGVSLPKCV